MTRLGPNEESEVSGEADFWVYVKPTGLYRCLEERRKIQPRFLRRNLLYTKENLLQREVRKAPKQADPRQSFCVRFAGFEFRSNKPCQGFSLSVFVSLCEEIFTPADRLYRPIANRLVHLERSGPVELLIPKPEDKVSGNLVALFMVWDVHPDLQRLKPRKVSSLCSDVWNGRQWLCFGWLPVGAKVWTAALNVATNSTDNGSLLKVDLEACTLDMYSSDAGTHLGITRETTPDCSTSMSVYMTMNWPNETVEKEPEATASPSVPNGNGVVEEIQPGGRQDDNPSTSPRSVIPSAPSVQFQYLYSRNFRFLTEISQECRCPFCGVGCFSIGALRAHLETSHDLFFYLFSVQDGINMVRICCPDDLYGKDCRMICRETELLMDRRNKSFTMYLPPAKRSFVGRMRQHTLSVRKFWEGRSMTMKQQMANRAGARPMRPEQDGRCGVVNISEAIAPRRGKGDRQGGSYGSMPNEDGRGHYALGSSGNNRMITDEGAGMHKWNAHNAYMDGPYGRAQGSESYYMDEMMEDQRPEGHPFYHSQTAMPMTLPEVMEGTDTDDEDDGELRKMQLRRDIHGLRDITEDEREFFKLWNTHCLRHPVRSDTCTPQACIKFAQAHADVLSTSAALRRTFSLFLLNLVEYDVLDAENLDKCNVIAMGGKVEEENGAWQIARN